MSWRDEVERLRAEAQQKGLASAPFIKTRLEKLETFGLKRDTTISELRDSIKEIVGVIGGDASVVDSLSDDEIEKGEHALSSVMEHAGLAPECVYAYSKMRMWLDGGTEATAEERAEWKRLVAEGRCLYQKDSVYRRIK